MLNRCIGRRNPIRSGILQSFFRPSKVSINSIRNFRNTQFLPAITSHRKDSSSFKLFQPGSLSYNFPRGLCTSQYDYDTECASFTWETPEYYNFATDVLDKWRRETPDSIAFWWVDDDGHEIKKTFRQLGEDSERVANFLTSTVGVKSGDPVLVILPRLYEWWLLNIALLRCGGIIIPGTTQLRANDVKYRLKESGSTCLVVSDLDLIKGIDTTAVNTIYVDQDSSHLLHNNQLIPASTGVACGDELFDFGKLFSQSISKFETKRTKSTDHMAWFFTSGTTGAPKIAVHNHSSYALGHIVTSKYWLGLSTEDVHWNMSDTGWAKAAFSSFYAPWISGSTVFVHHPTTRFQPSRILEIFHQYPITTFCGAPTVFRMLVQEDEALAKYSPQSLRLCVSAGEPLNPEVIEKWKKDIGLTILDGYGQTELVVVCGSFPFIENRPGSMGKPCPGVDLQIIDDDGNVLDSDVEGTIAVRVKPNRPVFMFDHYLNDPEKTEKCHIGDFYSTGDRGIKDSDGYFWFVGRDDDVIITAGYRVGPFEVESALIEHPDIVESAVVSSPHPDRGQIIKAFIVLKEGTPPSDTLKKDIQNHVKEITAPFKYPRSIEFVTDLPKTVSGKIRRVELRQKEWEI